MLWALLPKGKSLIRLLKLPISTAIDCAVSGSASSSVVVAQTCNNLAKVRLSLSVFAFSKG